jgi:hypothetical protein
MEETVENWASVNAEKNVYKQLIKNIRLEISKMSDDGAAEHLGRRIDDVLNDGGFINSQPVQQVQHQWDIQDGGVVHHNSVMGSQDQHAPEVVPHKQLVEFNLDQLMEEGNTDASVAFTDKEDEQIQKNDH